MSEIKLNIRAKRSLEKILEYADKGLLKASIEESCLYHDSHTGKFCAIGCLIPKRTLMNLKQNEMNHGTDAFHLFSTYPALIRTTGLTIDQAQGLQLIHDEWAIGGCKKEKFTRAIKSVLFGRQSKNLPCFK